MAMTPVTTTKAETSEQPDMKRKPLAVIRLDHAAVELWPTHVRTVFNDGAVVPAAPNGTETILDTAIHELLHHVYAQVKNKGESVCLRAAAQGDGKRWTPERLEEESFAFPAGQLLAPMVAQLVEVYGAVGSKYAQAADGTEMPGGKREVLF